VVTSIDDARSVLHKHPKTRLFVQVENSIARAPHLSLKATGLLVHLLSLPNGAPMGSRELAEVRPDGRHSILAAFKELRTHGHVHQTTVRRADGTYRTVTHVYECPEDASPGARTEPGHLARFPAKPGAKTAPPLSEKEQLLKNAGHRFLCEGCQAIFDDYLTYISHLEAGCLVGPLAE